MGKTSTASSLVSIGSSLLGSILGSYSSANSKKPYNTSVSVNGTPVASANVEKNTISTNYNMPDDEKNLLDYTNKNLLSGLENINVFSDEVQKSIQN